VAAYPGLTTPRSTPKPAARQYARDLEQALRHEAVCRLYERTTLSEIQIARITGHRSLAMLRRYASQRGPDLAQSLC
jgi:integrase